MLLPHGTGFKDCGDVTGQDLNLTAILSGQRRVCDGKLPFRSLIYMLTVRGYVSLPKGNQWIGLKGTFWGETMVLFPAIVWSFPVNVPFIQVRG